MVVGTQQQVSIVKIKQIGTQLHSETDLLLISTVQTFATPKMARHFIKKPSEAVGADSISPLNGEESQSSGVNFQGTGVSLLNGLINQSVTTLNISRVQKTARIIPLLKLEFKIRRVLLTVRKSIVQSKLDNGELGSVSRMKMHRVHKCLFEKKPNRFRKGGNYIGKMLQLGPI